MKINDIFAQAEAVEPRSADQISAFVDFALDAEDISEKECSIFACGYLIGITYALAKFTENRIGDAALLLLDRQTRWEQRGWL